MMKLLILTLLTLAIEWSGADFCGLPSCPNEHIDCIMELGDWGDDCLPDRNMLNLTAVQNQIVGRHNYHRNRIAGGQVSGFDPADRMGLMQWNITLANICRKKVRQCNTNGGLCQNTAEYNFVGQNLAYKKYPKTQQSTNIAIILELIDMWYNEIKKLTMNDMREYSDDAGGAHVSQMLKSYSTRVGCAVSSMTNSKDRTVFLCCNYDLGNFVGWPTYFEGKAGSKCKTGKDKTYTNLCSAKEQFNINAFWEDFE